MHSCCKSGLVASAAHLWSSWHHRVFSKLLRPHPEGLLGALTLQQHLSAMVMYCAAAMAP